MTELWGVALLLTASLLPGILLTREEKQRAENLRLCVSLVSHARRKIDHFSTPVGALFLDFVPESPHPPLDFSLPFPMAIEPLYPSLGGSAEIMRRFGENLGDGYRDDMLRLCDDTSEALREHLRALEHEMPLRSRMYIALPFLFVLSLLVLLV